MIDLDTMAELHALRAILIHVVAVQAISDPRPQEVLSAFHRSTVAALEASDIEAPHIDDEDERIHAEETLRRKSVNSADRFFAGINLPKSDKAANR